MSFVDCMSDVLNNEFNVSITENGALGYKTTGSLLLDFNFKVSSYRNKSDEVIINDFMKIYHDNSLLALKYLFYIRDARGGLGERRIFRVVISHLSKVYPDVIRKLLHLFSEYGRYDDLLVLIDSPIKLQVMEVIVNTINSDLEHYEKGEPISLLAKWLPSENTSSQKTRELATKIRKRMHLSSPTYRRLLSTLRSHIDIVEKKMSNNDWQNINYENVPSKASLNYKNAFMKHDHDRYNEYISEVSKGKAKINASVLYPHEIVVKYTQGYSCLKEYDETLEQLWNNLPAVAKDIGSTLCVRDGSGSMTWEYLNGTKAKALDVADALTIYFSDKCNSEFKDKFITFSSSPELIDLSSMSSLHDKLSKLRAHDDCSNTDIKKVFDLVLATAIKHNLTQEELPSNILIFSDMEFDGHAFNIDERLFSQISKSFEDAGYKLPRLIFWNICGRTDTIPMKENELGVCLVSGFSVNIVNTIMSGKMDPLECLLEVINSKRYNPIVEALL